MDPGLGQGTLILETFFFLETFSILKKLSKLQKIIYAYASLMSPALAGGFFTTSTTWEAHKHTTIWLIVCYNEQLDSFHIFAITSSTARNFLIPACHTCVKSYFRTYIKKIELLGHRLWASSILPCNNNFFSKVILYSFLFRLLIYF